MSLRILRDTEVLIQYLNDLIWLRIFKLTAKFIVHSCPHHTMHSCLIIEPLHVSVSHDMRSIGSRFFRCLIHKDVQNPLVYTILCTRPNIVLVMSVMSRYQSNPDEEHWIAVKNIFKYLRRTKNLFLIFGGDSELRLEKYTNSNFISDLDDRIFTS